MTIQPPPVAPYKISLNLSRDVQHALKAEKARRVLRNEPSPTIQDLASELLTKAALSLS